MKKLAVAALMMFIGVPAFNQTKPTLSDSDREWEMRLGQIEEISMCHHAIKAAYHDGLSLNENPYFRYVVNSPYKGRSLANVYPIPKRCKYEETSLILGYTNMSATDKAFLDKTLSNEIGMTISDVATDAQFMTKVVNKMDIEGQDADHVENMDKDIF